MNYWINIFQNEIEAMKNLRTKLYETTTNDEYYDNYYREQKEEIINEINRHLANILVGAVGLRDLALDEFEMIHKSGQEIIDGINEGNKTEETD